MSFSGDVKRELMDIIPASRHCRIAEIAAFVHLPGGREKEEAEGAELSFYTDSPEVADLLFTLVSKVYNIGLVITETEGRRRGRGKGRLLWTDDSDRAAALMASVEHPSLLRMECCRKAYLRGAFLAAGSVSDPEKSYHLEIVCPSAEAAHTVQGAMKGIGIDAKTVIRKTDHVVYLKEGDSIVSFLGAMGASISFLNLESVRVMKEMRMSVNRIVNCETANLSKTIESAVRQLEDIAFIRDNGGFADLPDTLREMAEVRLAYPDATLAELGTFLDPAIGKSGVNHRLRKLGAIAEKRRAQIGG
ncbi:MAG: DNA-binding protein WhiA [Lachnospiraceae bacterium]|nr:DNA-binding protein WhiA [Lachnospiraceae bacterium]